jgi:hypothetical protein
MMPDVPSAQPPLLPAPKLCAADADGNMKQSPAMASFEEYTATK